MTSPSVDASKIQPLGTKTSIEVNWIPEAKLRQKVFSKYIPLSKKGRNELKTTQDKKNCSEIEVGKYNRQTQSCQDFYFDKRKKTKKLLQQP